ncbi:MULTISPECIES: hypothetical protein [Moorena]|uniref:Uncharacterized protein n=1 Tax=Moorena producens 3L TaxID=489825 RepID=F4Y190_9CYAN|nr:MULTISPECIES: hypothetical protein [Moorena]EGJ29032.1 hypothetical protein LYNGBM3L_65080 [Moorena producens 3L]NEP67051.1 hypothetical protein [Moorena sp. SIO3A5]
MNHSSSELTRALTDLRDDILLEFEKNPDEQIPQLLQILRLFRQSQMTKPESGDTF